MEKIVIWQDSRSLQPGKHECIPESNELNKPLALNVASNITDQIY